ncbi:MAG: hypothetical protein ABIN89_04970 [Chitinophagaceae bacterium]
MTECTALLALFYNILFFFFLHARTSRARENDNGRRNCRTKTAAYFNNTAFHYLYGFTATPIRKNKDEQLVFIHNGKIIHEISIPVKGIHNKQLSVTIQNTERSAPFNTSIDKVETLLNNSYS